MVHHMDSFLSCDKAQHNVGSLHNSQDSNRILLKDKDWKYTVLIMSTLEVKSTNYN